MATAEVRRWVRSTWAVFRKDWRSELRTRYAMSALLMFVGLLLALSAVGIDLTALSVLGGAVGVGIGLGLQKLAANYVSGFVILAERSLRQAMLRLQVVSNRVIEVQEAERSHLARELHDQLGQDLAAVKLNAHAILRRCTDAADQALAQECLHLSDEAIQSAAIPPAR
mgnify:CR=1 FL=1